MIYCSQMRQLSPFYDTVAAFMHIFFFLFRVGRIFFTCSFAVHLSIKYIFIFTENIFLKYFAWFIIHKEVIMKILSNSPGVLWDCHMHSEFSADSGTPTEDMIRQAIALGFKGICFTEHLDPDYPPTPDDLEFALDIPAYYTKLNELKETYKNQIHIHFGIEIGLQLHLKQYFHNLLKEYPFDFVIGSSHVVHGADPYYPEFFQGRNEEQAYLEYFESILENLDAFHEMDTYGHLDYIVRYGPNKNQFYSYEKYRNILDAILKKLADTNVGLEVNTGGYHYRLGEPNPCTDIIRRYKELGGEIITIGADAHTPDKIGYAFDKASKVLKECGFEYYTVFENRKPTFVKL